MTMVINKLQISPCTTASASAAACNMPRLTSDDNKMMRHVTVTVFLSPWWNQNVRHNSEGFMCWALCCRRLVGTQIDHNVSLSHQNV